MATISNDGLMGATKRLNGVDSVPAFAYMAPGKSSTTESAAHTALQDECTESGMTRAAATCSYEADYKAKWVHQYTNSSGATVGLWEVAILNAASGGLMLLRHVFAAIQNVLDGGSIELTAVVTYSTS